jgi:Protein of unknown function (DUF3574)
MDQIPMRVIALAAILLLPGCMTAGLPSCPGGARPQLRAELIFGRGIKGAGTVSETAWRRFLDREVTPRFPDGFTVLDGSGQWRGPGAARIVKEASKVVVVAMADEPERRSRLDEIAAAYKRAFKQESVVSLLVPSCVSF